MNKFRYFFGVLTYEMELLKCSKNFITQFSQHMERKVHFLSLWVCVCWCDRECAHRGLLLQSWPMLTSKKTSFSFPSNNWVFYLRNTQSTHQFESLTRCSFFDDHFFRFSVLFCFVFGCSKLNQNQREKLSLFSCTVAKNHSNFEPNTTCLSLWLCSLRSH